jgi:hypothetical protein
MMSQLVEKAERNAENKQELAARAPGEPLVRRTSARAG